MSIYQASIFWSSGWSECAGKKIHNILIDAANIGVENAIHKWYYIMNIWLID